MTADDPPAAAAAPHPFRARRVRALALLGFSSGVPLFLTGMTLSAWMTAVDVDLTLIGAFSLVGLPYTFKWAWAPLLDRYRLPFLGRRRGWLLVLQLALVATIAAMGLVEPRRDPVALAVLAVVVAFLSASQDVLVDAYTADTLRPEERAAGSALYVSSYRAALLVTGAGSLRLADVVPWRLIYGGCAALMLVGVLGTLIAEEPPEADRRPPDLAAAFWMPLHRLLRQRRIAVVLAFVALFRFGDFFVTHLGITFLRRAVGYTFGDLALYNQLIGFAGTIAGGMIGGWLVPRVGLRRSLLWFGAAGALTNLLWPLLLVTGPRWPALVGVVLADQLTSTIATTAFVAFLLSRCEPQVSATQYALLTSLSSIGYRFLGFAGALLAKHAGWTALWCATAAAVVPALLLLPWLPLDDVRRAPS